MGEQLIVIASQPNLTAACSQKSWAKIEKVFGTAYYASREELVAAVKGHSHATTAEGFVDHCLANGWLREVTVGPQRFARTD